jgi:CheY-like chemotaxis protein
MADGPVRVLVVDDTPQIRLLLRVNLELEGHVVEEASDGATCLARLRDTTGAAFDVVLLDAEMHPLDGWATTAEIRRDAALAALPVLMVTASVQSHHRARARKVGVDAFITKPFEPSLVVETVERLARCERGTG